jgi:hypothetical protein
VGSSSGGGSGGGSGGSGLLLVSSLFDSSLGLSLLGAFDDAVQ